MKRRRALAARALHFDTSASEPNRDSGAPAFSDLINENGYPFKAGKEDGVFFMTLFFFFKLIFTNHSV